MSLLVLIPTRPVGLAPEASMPCTVGPEKGRWGELVFSPFTPPYAVIIDYTNKYFSSVGASRHRSL